MAKCLKKPIDMSYDAKDFCVSCKKISTERFVKVKYYSKSKTREITYRAEKVPTFPSSISSEPDSQSMETSGYPVAITLTKTFPKLS